MAVCVPFLGVPDMDKAVAWYMSIGFDCTGTNQLWQPGSELSWAQLEWEGAAFMLFPSQKENIYGVKDAGLYFKVSHVNGLVEKLKQYARIIELTEDPYSLKLDVVFEDLNGFRITFSCEPLG
jgi:hypothetical protein